MEVSNGLVFPIPLLVERRGLIDFPQAQSGRLQASSQQ